MCIRDSIQAMLISMPILMMEAVLVGIASAYIVSITSFNEMCIRDRVRVL